MKKKVLINFIKDKLTFTIGYFLNAILILLYVYLLNTQIGLLYPLSLSIVLYIFIILNEWIKYYKFNINLNEGIETRYFNLNPKTNEQKEAAKAILKIHENYTNKISSIYAQNTDNKYFLSQWIHSIKTPTSIIDLVIQKATKDISFHSKGTENILKIFFDIREENNKVRNGLNQVLNISRLSDFSKDYEPQTVNLVILLRKVINNKKNQFIYNNVFPKIEFQYEEVFIITDEKWNEFILEQIISNAIKYSAVSKEKKYIYFNICINHKEIKLIIRDDGIGIPSCDIKRIFQPFFTGENGRKVHDATGIGLYICKLISKKLNHNILIESESNKGTTVSIIYPMTTHSNIPLYSVKAIPIKSKI